MSHQSPSVAIEDGAGIGKRSSIGMAAERRRAGNSGLRGHLGGDVRRSMR